MRLAHTTVLAGFVALALAGSAQAQSQINLIIGADAGGGYDVYGRSVGRHIGKYLPGNPTIVPQNMPGAGSNRAAEYIYTQAPKDGSAFGILFPGAVMSPLRGVSGDLKFDPTKFNYIGTAAKDARVCVTRKDAKVKSFADALKTESIVAASSEGGSTADYAVLANEVLGAKFKIVRGYKGTREMLLAVERGEADGLCGYNWTSLKTQRPDWISGEKANILVQFGMETDRDLDKLKVPSIWSFIKNDADKQLFELLIAEQEFGRPFVMPPGVPADKLKAFRDAFAKTLEDKEYGSGEEVQKLVDRLYAMPKAVVSRMAEVMKPK